MHAPPRPQPCMCGELFAPRSASRPARPAPFDKLTCRGRRDRRAQLRPLHRARPAGARAADGSSLMLVSYLNSPGGWAWHRTLPVGNQQPQYAATLGRYSPVACWSGLCRADTCLQMRNAGTPMNRTFHPGRVLRSIYHTTTVHGFASRETRLSRH